MSGGKCDIINKTNFNPDLVYTVVNMINQNEYKRRQMPVGIRITSKAFTYGRKIPIAANLNYY